MVSKTTVQLPEDVHRTLRVKAALERRSMNDLLVEAVRGYLGDLRFEMRGNGPNPSLSVGDRVSRERRT